MHYPAYQNQSFFRPPSWRWDRIVSLVDQFPTPGRCSRHDDEFIRVARAFVLRMRATEGDSAAEASLWFETPDLCNAYEFYLRLADESRAAMFLEARLLAGQSFETIAEATGVSPGMVKWYEALYFNVVDRLHQRDWVTNQVLIPAMKRDPLAQAKGPFQDQNLVDPFLDGSIKMFAYFGGPYVVDALLSGFKPGSPVTSPDDVNNWLDRQLATTVRKKSAQAAMQFGINKFNVMELFAMHAKIIELDRSDDVGETARSSYEKSIKALLDSIPFTAGDDGGAPHKGTILPRLDTMAAELRDAELLMIAAGHPVPNLEEDWPPAFPPPRETPATIAHEDAIN